MTHPNHSSPLSDPPPTGPPTQASTAQIKVVLSSWGSQSHPRNWARLSESWRYPLRICTSKFPYNAPPTTLLRWQSGSRRCSSPSHQKVLDSRAGVHVKEVSNGESLAHSLSLQFHRAGRKHPVFVRLSYVGGLGPTYVRTESRDSHTITKSCVCGLLATSRRKAHISSGVRCYTGKLDLRLQPTFFRLSGVLSGAQCVYRSGPWWAGMQRA